MDTQTEVRPTWGIRASDWAATEEQQAPTYSEALRRLGIDSGDAVLEVGCGSGVFLELAAARGASVAGIDISPELVALARDRVAGADVRLGDMQDLPFGDASFDLVAGFDSFFFADDMVAALSEAARVTKPGGRVLIQVWGRPERCDLSAVKRAVFGWTPEPEPLCARGVLEGLATAAGLVPDSAFDVSYAFDYPDRHELVARMLAPAPIAAHAARKGDAVVARAIVDSLAPYRRADGGYVLVNEWHHLITRKPS
jgi:SAM-dependent methyltransferase